MWNETVNTSSQLEQAFKVISEHLTDNNAHTLELLLAWQCEARTFTDHEDEVLSRAYLCARNFIQQHTDLNESEN